MAHSFFKLRVISLCVLLPLHSLAQSVSFPLTTRPLPVSMFKARRRMLGSTGPGNVKFGMKYSMGLVVSLPLGTPAQSQNLILDTGSQLSWVPCGNQIKPAQASGASSSTSLPLFNPTVSTSFSPLSCKDPVCKPPVPDFSIPTACDQKQLCQYSYFYADGTLAEGNLVMEKIAVSTPLSSSSIALGCSVGSKDDNGLLGMNMGRLSFVSQSKIKKFSYCVPARFSRTAPSSTGAFYLGENPSAASLQYVNLIKFPESQRMPNLDPLAYTVPMSGIRIGTSNLNISVPSFRPNAGGSGQTFVDSGSELTYLVDEAYAKVKEAVVALTGTMMKKDFSYSGVADLCFDDGVAPMAANKIRSIGLKFDGGVEISVGPETLLMDAGNGVKCLPIGRSSMLGSASNIIGNVHQQNLWVEYDIEGSRIGFGKADCSRSYSQ